MQIFLSLSVCLSVCAHTNEQFFSSPETKLQAALLRQEHYPPKVDEIFPAISLLIIPDLTRMFRQQKRRFKKRTSSAIWETPPSKYFRYMSPK